jgi:protein tyrosine phosphatase
VKLANIYAKVNEMCEKEWKRNQESDAIQPAKCRYTAIKSGMEYKGIRASVVNGTISASSHLVSIYPYGTKTSMESINAVFVDGFRRKGQFIVTEAPMANTVEQFWRMIQQQKVEQVIVLNEPHGNREVILLLKSMLYCNESCDQYHLTQCTVKKVSLREAEKIFKK